MRRSLGRAFGPAVIPLLMLGGCGSSPEVVAQGQRFVEVEWPTDSSAGAQAQDIGNQYCGSGHSAAMVMENWHGDTNTPRLS